MMRGSLQSYIETLRASLPSGLGARHTARILREVEEHILETFEEEQMRGATPEEALRRALARMGSPAFIAEGFNSVVDTRRIRLGRLVLLAGLGMALLAVGAPLITYPHVTHSSSATLRDLLLWAGILGLYAWAGLDTVRANSPDEAEALWYGMTAGLGTSMLTFCSAVCSMLLLALLWGEGTSYVSSAALLRLDHGIQELAVGIPILTGLVLSLLAGSMAATRTGRISMGALAGMWSGMLGAIGIAAPGLLLNNPVADTLARMEWIHDPTCLPAHGAALAACEVGDSLGGVAICFLIVPLLGIGLGIVGGLLSRRPGAAWFSHLGRPEPAPTAVTGTVTTLSASTVVDAAQRESSQDTHAGTLALFSAILLAALIAALQLHI
jgi:hypothetical protein